MAALWHVSPAASPPAHRSPGTGFVVRHAGVDVDVMTAVEVGVPPGLEDDSTEWVAVDPEAVEAPVPERLMVDAPLVRLVDDDSGAVELLDSRVSVPHSITGLQPSSPTTVMQPGARHSR
jgi:hypothetical protein